MVKIIIIEADKENIWYKRDNSMYMNIHRAFVRFTYKGYGP